MDMSQMLVVAAMVLAAGHLLVQLAIDPHIVEVAAVAPYDSKRWGIGVVPPLPDDWEGWKYKWRDDRWNQWLAYAQFHMVPNFTEHGYEMVPMPVDVHTELKEYLESAMQHETHKEGAVNIISEHGEAADKYDNQELVHKVHGQLQSMHEEWAGVSLEKTSAFGFRVYRGGNVLKKHVDRVETHIISSIVHIGRDIDEPWYLSILNNDGVAQHVDLKPGHMLFYESARLMHWRSGKMKGRYYCSLFLHYKPVGWPLTEQGLIDVATTQKWDTDTSTDIQYAAQDIDLADQPKFNDDDAGAKKGDIQEMPKLHSKEVREPHEAEL